MSPPVPKVSSPENSPSPTDLQDAGAGQLWGEPAEDRALQGAAAQPKPQAAASLRRSARPQPRPPGDPEHPRCWRRRRPSYFCLGRTPYFSWKGLVGRRLARGTRFPARGQRDKAGVQVHGCYTQGHEGFMTAVTLFWGGDLFFRRVF